MYRLDINIKNFSDDIERFILETEKNNKSSSAIGTYIENLKNILLRYLKIDAS